MSTQEKLAWAKQHGVTPPEYVLAAAESDDSAGEPTSCCASKQSPPDSTCCSSAAQDDREETTHTACASSPATQNSPRQLGWIPGIQAQKCQGVSLLWLASGAVLPPPPPPKPPVNSAPPQWCSHALVCRWQGIAAQPDVPPPQSRPGDCFGQAS